LVAIVQRHLGPVTLVALPAPAGLLLQHAAVARRSLRPGQVAS
jgi:hypothetical protein